MNKYIIAAMMFLLAVSSHAEEFDFKEYVDGYFKKGDSLKFKCVDDSGAYDFITLYGEDEMLWARYVNDDVVKTMVAKPEITKNSMTLSLEEEFEGSRERRFSFVSKSGNKVVWESVRQCITSF